MTAHVLARADQTRLPCVPDQVVVFDLEYGQPAASTTLPTSRPAFRDLLGCFGHADAGKRVLESGVDLLYTSHQVNTTLLTLEEFPWHTVSTESAKAFSCGQQCESAQGKCTSMWEILVRCAVCISTTLSGWSVASSKVVMGAVRLLAGRRVLPPSLYKQHAELCSYMCRTGACRYGGARPIS